MSIILGIFFSVIFFSAQALLCVRARSFAVRLIPAIIIVLSFVIALMSDSFFGGAILGTITVLCAVGDGMAWLVYYLMNKRK